MCRGATGDPGGASARRPGHASRAMLEQLPTGSSSGPSGRAWEAIFAATRDPRVAADWCDDLARLCDDARTLRLEDLLAWLHSSPPPELEPAAARPESDRVGAP